MARFRGIVGFIKAAETSPGSGIFSEVATEKTYGGDVIRDSKKWETTPNLNDDVSIGNRFSIVADTFANENFSYMKYVKWMGFSWKITNVEVQRPRLILTVGEKYNGP